ncbi:hypothetical protein F5Y08DRAFT_92379 [Xylaria arbuscula]|nr:hypothetical protein F5Y08DRAFT_92379 [Xylaria arbuscula]
MRLTDVSSLHYSEQKVPSLEGLKRSWRNDTIRLGPTIIDYLVTSAGIFCCLWHDLMMVEMVTTPPVSGLYILLCIYIITHMYVGQTLYCRGAITGTCDIPLIPASVAAPRNPDGQQLGHAGTNSGRRTSF